MKSRLLIIVCVLIFTGLVGTSYASVEITAFDLKISSDNFYESFPNKYPYLIMKPSDSQQIAIKITNNDSNPHTINLFMAKETPRPDRHFVFEPSQIYLESGETASSILTVSSSSEADVGTTILHTLIAQSTSFGAKSFAFYFEVTEQIHPPSPDPLRMSPDGLMFSPTAQFNLSENKIFEMISYDILPPTVPDEYSLQVMDGSKEEPRLTYSKEKYSENMLISEFGDDEEILQIIFEREEFFTYDDYLQFLNPNEQQVRINGKGGISSSVQLQTTDGEEYLASRVVVFLDEVKIRLESNMQEEQLLRISESMIKPNMVSEPMSEEEEPYVDPDHICPPGLVLDWDICIDECRIGQIESNGICIEIDSDSVDAVQSYFVITVASIFGIMIIVIVVIFMSRRKRKWKEI